MEVGDIAAVKIRAEAAGLDLDDERLRMLADSLREFGEMMAVVEQIEVDPVDLALEPFDPAWPEGDRSR